MPEGAIYMSSLGEQLGTMNFETPNISASGGPDFPLLRIRTNITLHPLREATAQGSRLRPVSLIRATGQFETPAQRVVARFQDDILLDAHDDSYPRTTQVTFEIPLDLTTLARIERDRAGADLRVQLTFKLLFAQHGGNGLPTFHSGRVDGLNFVIPRSHWVDHLLPGLGYGGLEILEIRYGQGFLASQLPKCAEEIKQAKRALSEGQWDRAMLSCRKAVELILDSGKASSPPVTQFPRRVETFLHDNLPALDDVEAKLLSGQMQLIWEVTSATGAHAAHLAKAADAEFVLRATMALVEYFSRLLT
jgi:hypothetical protein